MNKYWNQFMIAAVLIMSLFLIPGCLDKGGRDNQTKFPEAIKTPVQDEKSTNLPPAESSGRFLTLPFADQDVEIVQGYYYDWDRGGNPTHMGIDYIKRDPGNPAQWLNFDVTAAADGIAMQNEHPGIGFGRYVVIRHQEKESGIYYFTLYAHLDSVESFIPHRSNWDGNHVQWAPVSGGDKIGVAGDSGSPGWIHLHFEVFTGRAGSSAERLDNRIDPYDINGYKVDYPVPPDVISGSGPNHLWLGRAGSEEVLGASVQSREPFTYHEYGLESLGLNKELSIEEAILILGRPLSINDLGLDIYDNRQVELVYEGLRIGFSDNSSFNWFVIETGAIAGPRGIRVGDPVEKVLRSYLRENETPGIWKNPDAQYWDMAKQSVELYYLEEEGMVKTGVMHCDKDSGEVINITYSHYLPASCGYSGLTFMIENGLVKEIWR